MVLAGVQCAAGVIQMVQTALQATLCAGDALCFNTDRRTLNTS